MNREILFPTPLYFKDLPNAKELNKYLFKHIKAWRKADPKVKIKLIQVLVGIVKQTRIIDKSLILLHKNYLKWGKSVIKIMVLHLN